MKHSKKYRSSDSSHDEATRIARGTQRPGQTKEQTKLIAKGIEKGIAEFRKREKAKARERDKLRKKTQKKPVAPEQQADQTQDVQDKKPRSWAVWVPSLALWQAV